MNMFIFVVEIVYAGTSKQFKVKTNVDKKKTQNDKRLLNNSQTLQTKETFVDKNTISNLNF